MIKEYFQDGCNFGVNIKYINEDIPLGTAGSLSKFKSDNKKDFLVCNGDVLTDISFAQLMSHHFEQKATATMAVRRYHWQHPFGVIKTEKNKLQIKSIHEKPIQETFVNAGIYVFKDKVKDWIKKDKKLEMPSLFKLLRRKKEKTIIFPMYESWLDIGNSKEYEEAQKKTKK
jgi:NDP-sugar pyrophosphorylase family protein